MSRYNDLINAISKQTVFCNNLGFGEQGAVLNQLDKAIVICADIEKARKLKAQLDGLKKDNALIDDFDNPFTISKFQSNENRIDLFKALKRFVKLCVALFCKFDLFMRCNTNTIVIQEVSVLPRGVIL